MDWLAYTSMIITFLNGIVLIWILKLVIEAGYEHKVYTKYLLYRALSILCLLIVIMAISFDHLISPPENLDSTKQNLLNNYMISTITLQSIAVVYIVISTIVYTFHLSIVKEFYKIVSIIIETREQTSILQRKVYLAAGVPDFCVGMPLVEDPKLVNAMSDEDYALSMKQANFEYEIEIHNSPRRPADSGPTHSRNDSFKNKGKNLSKIKIIECMSESSEASDSFRIQPTNLSMDKKSSCKVIKGSPITMDEGFFNFRDRTSMKAPIGKKVASIDEESDSNDEKYGLDYLEEYQNRKASICDDGRTAYSSDKQFKMNSFKKVTPHRKVSVSKVTRNKTFFNNNMTRVRSFTADHVGA